MSAIGASTPLIRSVGGAPEVMCRSEAPRSSTAISGGGRGPPSSAASASPVALRRGSAAVDPLRKATGEADDPDDGVHLTPLLIAVMERGASDLHTVSYTHL